MDMILTKHLKRLARDFPVPFWAGTTALGLATVFAVVTPVIS